MLDGMWVHTIVLMRPTLRASHVATGNENAERMPDQKKNMLASESDSPNFWNSHKASRD